MSSKSSLLPGLLSRRDEPILPLHSSMSTSVRRKPSEYDLSDLSPRPGNTTLPFESTKLRKSPSPGRRRSSSPSAAFLDRARDSGWASESKPRQPILFAGPPPPIATSQYLYRDEEDRGPSLPSSRASLAQSITSVLFDRRSSSSPHHPRDNAYTPKPDATWLNLQRRERALHQDLQRLLDAQSAGLAAHLDPNPDPPPAARSSNASVVSSASAGASISSTTTAAAAAAAAAATTPHRRRVSFNPDPTSAFPPPSDPAAVVIPVRQPRPAEPPSLRAARAGLARAMAQLADLRADEDAQLAAALAARKQALARLRRLVGKREGVVRELRALEGVGVGDDEDESEDEGEEDDRGEEAEGGYGGDGGDGRRRRRSRRGTGVGGNKEDELTVLTRERDGVVAEMRALEERLAGLRERKRWLDGRVQEVKSRREAGLSGYRGALREVEGRIRELLVRPEVRPLDLDVVARRGSTTKEGEEGNGWDWEGKQGHGGAITGKEFFSLRPERRTAEMAREWWEGEVAVLERRKAEVDRERAALEEGAEVWKGAVEIVSEFEAGLRREMSGGATATTKPKSKKGGAGDGRAPSPPATPEQAMYAQLKKMRAVMAGLEERLRLAEEKGWNLLICAIGAELEAFRQAEDMLLGALRSAGFEGPDASPESGDEEQAGSTPRMGRSATLRNSGATTDAARAGGTGSGNLVDLGEEKTGESDNEVPADLLVAAEDDREQGPASPALSREESNEVPIEFLVEHPRSESPEPGAFT